MPIKIRCACGNVLLASEDRVGQTGRCPSCNRDITVTLPTSDSETAEIEASFAKLALESSLSQSHIAQSQSSTKHLKPCWLTRILTIIFYTFFILLLGGFLALHIFGDQTIRNFSFSSPSYLSKLWEFYKEPLILVKAAQRRSYKRWLHKIWNKKKHSLPQGLEKFPSSLSKKSSIPEHKKEESVVSEKESHSKEREILIKKEKEKQKAVLKNQATEKKNKEEKTLNIKERKNHEVNTKEQTSPSLDNKSSHNLDNSNQKEDKDILNQTKK